MTMRSAKVTPIPLYRNVAGRSLFASENPAFQDYRKRWKEQPLNFYPGDFPLFIDIEVTNACNLLCSFCATTNLGLDMKRGFIPEELVYKILDEGKDNGLCGVKFNDRGEPLLHPGLTDFVKYAKGAGLIDVYFNTNAMLLTEDKIEKVIDSGMDRISISIEGFSPDFYEKYRINGKFDVLLKNVRNLWAIRSKKKAKNPLIRIQSVLLPEIQKNLSGYMSKYSAFWSPYADEISVIEYKNESYPAIREKGFAYAWACHQPWQRMVVWCDGTILPCNEDNTGALSLGNIRSTSIKSAWNSRAMERLRERHKGLEAHLLAACDGCFLRDAQINKLMEEETRKTHEK